MKKLGNMYDKGKSNKNTIATNNNLKFCFVVGKEMKKACFIASCDSNSCGKY